MNKVQKECLQGMQKIAADLKAKYASPNKRMYVPKYGIDNSFGWEPFLPLAEKVSGEKIENEFKRGPNTLTPYRIKKELFALELIRVGRSSDIFADLCLNDYWHWSLVEAVAQAALSKKRFPIDAECFVDAIESLKKAIPAVKFDALESSTIRILSDSTTTYNLVPRSEYLTRRVENADRPSFEKLLRKNISEGGYQEYLEHGLILVDDEYDSDPKTADIRFNKLLLLDWQLGQRGSFYVHRGGLKIKKDR